MKKRAYLAVLAVCIALTGSACGPESPTSGSSSNGENTEKNMSTVSVVSEPKGFGTRLVSVENVEKYISLAEYKGLVLDKSLYGITDEQVEEQVRYTLQLERKEVKSKKDGVKPGDLVTINYVGTVGGKTLESEDYYDLIVGEGGMAEGFEEGLIGMKKGETRTLQIAFPEDFYTGELAGAVVTYRVMLQSFKRIPEITDKLVASQTDASSLEEYRQMVREQMEANAEADLQEMLKNTAWDTVLLNSEVREYPQMDIENAIDEFKKQVMLYNNGPDLDLEAFVKSQGMTMEAFEAQCRQYAESKVKQNLIIQAIMDAEGISLDDEECLKIQEQLITDFGAESLAELLDTYGQTMIDEAIGLIRIENFIVENAEIEEPVTEIESTEADSDSSENKEEQGNEVPTDTEAVQDENASEENQE